MKKKIDLDKLKTFLTYLISGVAILGVVFVGTADKNNNNSTLSQSMLDTNKYQISTDQVTEMYVVADLSSALNLASAENVAYSYVSMKTLYDVGQTTTGNLEKPAIIDTSGLARGVDSYIVQEGETMESIAAKFGLTTDQIRWSNGLKNTNVSVGDTLYIAKNVSGIVYTVKSGDTLETIAQKYGSSVDDIKHLNDLEVSGITEGMKIAIEGGSLPEKERPEYVAPVVVATTTYSYTTYGGYGSRLTLEVINPSFWTPTPYTAGQCTSWAWINRQDLPGNLGNAYSWAANAAAAGFPVDHNPQPGDVFQHGGGWYGHVGYVEAVNEDGTVVISEANYGYYPGRVTRSLISAQTAASFNYIHRK